MCSLVFACSIVFSDAPTITLNPISTEVRTGTQVVLTCNATASMDLKVTWYKDGRPLDGATERRLTVTADQYDKQGYYLCEFSTAYKKIATEPALLVLSGLYLINYERVGCYDSSVLFNLKWRQRNLSASFFRNLNLLKRKCKGQLKTTPTNSHIFLLLFLRCSDDNP